MKHSPFINGLLLFGLAAASFAATDTPKEQVFKLREVSALTLGQDNFRRGQTAYCQEEPAAEVKAYPTFKSKKPAYGSVRFGQKYGEPDSGWLFYFALDESGGTGGGYDRLYFDRNQDLDLRNDPVRKRRKNPPEGALLPYSWIEQQVVYDFLEIDFEADPAGKCSVQLMARLIVSGSTSGGNKRVTFVRPQLYEGEIQVGRRTFLARLGNDYNITGPLNAPGSALVLSKSGNESGSLFRWWGGERLMAVHKIDGQFFTFSANPSGTELRVAPYQGDLGTFKMGAGQRDLETLTVSGSLRSRNRAVAVGEVSEGGWPESTSSYQIPVGDYVPSYLSMRFGRLGISVSYNYHSDGKPRDRGGRGLTYGIRIRKERPFVLDFSDKPEVMFASPAKDQRIKLGETLEVKGVLIDPKLDLMIRRLDDTTRKQTKTAEGKPLPYERNLSLDPVVIVRRANGEKVAEGVMPFG